MREVDLDAHAEHVLVVEHRLLLLLALDHLLRDLLGHPEPALGAGQLVHHQAQLARACVERVEVGLQNVVDVIGEAVVVLLVERDQLAHARERLVLLQVGDRFRALHHPQLVDCLLDLPLQVALELVGGIRHAHRVDVAHYLLLTLLLGELAAVRLELVLLLAVHLLEARVHERVLDGFALLQPCHRLHLVARTHVDGRAVSALGTEHFVGHPFVEFVLAVAVECAHSGRASGSGLSRSRAVTCIPIALVVGDLLENDVLVLADLDLEFGLLVVQLADQ